MSTGHAFAYIPLSDGAVVADRAAKIRRDMRLGHVPEDGSTQGREVPVHEAEVVRLGYRETLAEGRDAWVKVCVGIANLAIDNALGGRSDPVAGSMYRDPGGAYSRPKGVVMPDTLTPAPTGEQAKGIAADVRIWLDGATGPAEIRETVAELAAMGHGTYLDLAFREVDALVAEEQKYRGIIAGYAARMSPDMRSMETGKGNQSDLSGASKGRKSF